tara:strand:+ start:1879 stop:2001 length:123 start_codon:yes stop_codon:yes gene_type:complete
MKNFTTVDLENVAIFFLKSRHKSKPSPSVVAFRSNPAASR